jgi:LysM repeat protein
LITKHRIGEHIYLTIVPILVIILVMISPCKALAEKNEETYDISLVQTAEVDREIVKVEDKKVLTESYTIKKGDHVWKILRNRGLLEKRNLMEILAVLKKLNSSFANLDLVHPGEKIIIPLVITPLTEEDGDIPEAVSAQAAVPLDSIEDIEHYTVRPGDSIIKIIRNHYDIPKEYLYDEYLNQLKKINPDIKNIDKIYPGQKVRLPIYSPKVVRAPINKPADLAAQEEADKKERLKIGDKLGEIFSLIGEEWVKEGKHFIPLKTGGQVSLNADSYPILNLRSGNKIILDLYNELPDKMADLIVSNWDNYRIVHLERGDDLTTAIDKVLKQCEYNKVYNNNESLRLGGDLSININADWIIRLFPEPSPTTENIVFINLVQEDDDKTPDNIKRFLKEYGIIAIDYPPSSKKEATTVSTEIKETGNSKSAIAKVLLDLVDQAYSAKTEIPIYQRENTDFNVMIKADYLLKIDGRNAVIDLNGLGKDVISLLKERQFMVLSLSDVKGSIELAVKILEFLEVDFNSGRQSFLATGRDKDKNIEIIINGMTFRDKDNNDIFATNIKLPTEILEFLSVRGKKILQLPSESEMK